MTNLNQVKLRAKEYMTKNNIIFKDGHVTKNGESIESEEIINELCRRNIITPDDIVELCFGGEQ